MRRPAAAVVAAALALTAAPSWGQAPEKIEGLPEDWYQNGWVYGRRAKLTVSNPSVHERRAEPVTLGVAQVKASCPDFNPDAFVIVDPAAAPDDPREYAGNDIPRQADDLNGDGEADEIAFQVELAPEETKELLVYYRVSGNLPLDYTPHTFALFSQRYEGAGWESDLIACRVYFDQRNAVDIFGKIRPRLSLSVFADPAHNFHEWSGAGMDVLMVRQSLGVGGFALWREGRMVKPASCVRSCRTIARGPVRAMVEIAYDNWRLNGQHCDAVARFTIWAHHRWTEQRVWVHGIGDFVAAAGIVKMDPEQTQLLRGVGWVGTWGRQSDNNDNLGLGVVFPKSADGRLTEDGLNHLLLMKGREGQPVVWRIVAAWEKEAQPITTAAGFEMLLRSIAGDFDIHPVVRIGSAESLPTTP